MTLWPRKRSRHEVDSRGVRVGAIRWMAEGLRTGVGGGRKEEIGKTAEKKERIYDYGEVVCIQFGRLSFQTRDT